MKHLVAIAVLAVVVAACGGGETESDTGPDEPGTTTTTAGASGATTTTAADADDGQSENPPPADVSGLGEGTVTINGETYLFGDAGFPAVQCQPDFFGVFFVALEQVDESGAAVPGGSLQLTLLLEGTDPDVVGQNNEGRVLIEDQEWIAEPEDIAERGLEAGTSQIDSYTVSGNSVSGTATFYEEESYFSTTGGSSDPILTAQGSFEVTCSGE